MEAANKTVSAKGGMVFCAPCKTFGRVYCKWFMVVLTNCELHTILAYFIKAPRSS